MINNIVQRTIQASQQQLSDLTQHGLLVGVAEQIEHTDLRKKLEALSLKMKTVRFRPADKALTVIVSVAIGCEDNLEINTKLRPDRVAAELFGMPEGRPGELPQFPEQSTVSDYQRATTAAYVHGLREIHHQLLSENRCAQPDEKLGLYVIDTDTTFYQVYGKTYENSDKGFSGRSRCTTGYRQGWATYADTKEFIEMTFLSARPHDLSHLPVLIEGIRRHHPDLSQVVFRGDAHFGSIESQIEYQRVHLHYVCAGFDPGTAERLARAATGAWIEVEPGVQLYECGYIQLGASHSQRKIVRTRVVLDRRPKEDGIGYDYKHYVSDLPESLLSTTELYSFYYGRENSESDIGERKNQLHTGSLRSRKFLGICTFQWLAGITSNLLIWMQKRRLYETPLAEVGRHKLITEAMQVPAQIIRLGKTWCVTWAQEHPLAQWLVRAFNRALKQVTPGLGYQMNLPLHGVFFFGRHGVACHGP